MKLRKYRAVSEADAFRQVRADLGPDAIVLSTRPVRPRGLRGWIGNGQPEIEVTAVADLLAANRPDPEPPMPALPAARPASSRVRQEYAEIRATLAEINAALGRMNHAGQTAVIDGLHDNLRDVHARLLDQEVDPDLAERLVTAVREELSPRALEDRRTVADCLRRHMLHLIPRPEPIDIPAGLPISLFLVGPTGVGKTTTIAKLAARFALLEGQRVALITVDTFRIAAAEQLRVYADIIGLPLEVAYTTGELAAAIHRHRDKDIILIDTPGRSQRNVGHLNDLHAYLQAAPARLVYLTIDACTRYADMLDVAKRFSPGKIDGLIVTKIDETAQYGALLNLVEHTRRPLTYLTTGQEVPDDIEEVTAHRVADLVLGGIQ
jgi:flagellar biosynthesis protein FlhF